MIAAIVPAAGRSERMGQPKLILPIEGQSVIARVVLALRQGGVDPVLVVAPPRDTPGANILIKESGRAGATVVIAATRPADMRASFELGLSQLAGAASPSAVLLAPGDSPGMTPDLVAQLVRHAKTTPQSILIPTYQGKRGHPIVLPWSLALESRDLPGGAGLNALVALHTNETVEIKVGEPGTLDDLDTPEDYQRWTTPRLEHPARR